MFQVMLGAVDCTGAPNKEICGKYGVKGYPTLIYLSYGAIPHKYSGGRDQAAFVKVSGRCGLDIALNLTYQLQQFF